MPLSVVNQPLTLLFVVAPEFKMFHYWLKKQSSYSFLETAKSYMFVIGAHDATMKTAGIHQYTVEEEFKYMYAVLGEHFTSDALDVFSTRNIPELHVTAP